MPAPRTQKATAVEKAAITKLRAFLSVYLAPFNVELVDQVTLVLFEDHALQVRDESALDGGAFPQNTGGVRVRVTDSVPVHTVSIGEQRMHHTLEVSTSINAQDTEYDTTVPPPMNGAVRVGHLAEMVDEVIRGRLIGTAGIYNITLKNGHKPQAAPPNMPSVREKVWTYDVWQRVRRPIQDETMPAYGSWYIATPGDTQVVVADTPEVLDVTTTAGPLQGVTHSTSGGLLTVTDAGVYEFEAVATVAHSANNTVVHLEMYVNGVQVESWDQQRLVATGGDIGNMSIIGQINVAAGSTFRLSVLSDKNGTITWTHLAGGIVRVDA